MSDAARVADRLAALNAAANRHGGDHELSAVCSHLHSALPKLAAENERLRAALEAIVSEYEGYMGTGQMLREFAQEALNG